jgi:hypothetical protein
MKIKLVLLIALIAVVGSSITVLVMDSKARKVRQAPASQLPTALSNYNQTFKLNTNPPLWPESQKSGGTNGRPGN